MSYKIFELGSIGQKAKGDKKMTVVLTANDVRIHRWKFQRERWGLVPVWENLTEGHIYLVRRAVKENDRVSVCQWEMESPTEPKIAPPNPAWDLVLLEREGVDLVWKPARESLWSPDFETYIKVKDTDQRLQRQAGSIPLHCITTAVAKLLNLFQPQRAYFGQNNEPYAIVVKKMAKDLNFDVKILIGPTNEEPMDDK